MDTSPPDTMLSITDEAREAVLGLRADEPQADTLALWLEVNGAAGGEFTYDLYFQARADAAAGDAVVQAGQLPVVVPAASVDRLRGATLDVRDGGMVIVNPNRPPAPASPAMGPPTGDLSGEVAQRVLQVLEGQVNPSIAAHGGWAELVAVEEGTAYLRLGGGCQGCGMARVTLGQGIEVAIRDAVPEITAVVDVTDHAEGTNPYYERAKK